MDAIHNDIAYVQGKLDKPGYHIDGILIDLYGVIGSSTANCIRDIPDEKFWEIAEVNHQSSEFYAGE